MPLYANGSVQHDGQEYKDGESLPEGKFSKEQLEALKEAGSAVSSKKELDSAADDEE